MYLNITSFQVMTFVDDVTYIFQYFFRTDNLKALHVIHEMITFSGYNNCF